MGEIHCAGIASLIFIHSIPQPILEILAIAIQEEVPFMEE